MGKFEHITVEEAKELVETTPVIFADIRDAASFHTGHIKGAHHLTNENLAEFIRDNDLDKPLIVYCYHGNSSQPAAEFLSSQGFDKVYSLIGGFTAWQ